MMTRNSIAICFLLYISTLLAGLTGVNAVASAITPYEFISLNSDPHHLNQTSFSRPTINNIGVVAYIDNRGFSDRWVIIDDGTTQTEIDLDIVAGFDGNAGKAMINDQGAVAVVFDARVFNSPRRGLLLRFNADSTVTTLAAYNADGITGDFIEIHPIFISMNNFGEVAAQVRLNTGESAVVIIDDGGFAVIDTVTANRFTFTGAAINDAGIVAYKAQEPAPDFVSVFTGDGFSPAQKSLPVPNACGSIGAGPDINNNGLSAGQGPACLVVGSGGLVTEVVVDVNSNPFNQSIGRLSLNNLDQIVFETSTNGLAGSTGLYFGDDPVQDKLIQQGDPLLGETLAQLLFWGDGGFNDQGQVAFLGSTVSVTGAPTAHIIRADLLSPPDADGDGVPDIDDLCPGTVPNADVDEFGCSAEQLDADGDGVPDATDQCPGTIPGISVDPNGCADLQVDTDGDGVCNPDATSSGPAACTGSDVCANTIIPESVPTLRLLKNRYTLSGYPSNRIFESSNKTEFTTEDTAGCSCEQIIDVLGLGGGLVLFGCSKSTMEAWSELLN
jgi:hypothetical protein